LIVRQATTTNYATADPDVRLMLQVRDDDGAAFEELVLRYQNRLVTLLEHLVGNRDQAEDLAQEVFLRVYRARKDYLPEARFATWLFTICANIASNAVRQRSRRREVVLRMGDSASSVARPCEILLQASSGQMPARQLDKAEMRDVVRQALAALNERQRMAVLLSKFEGLSYADIAQCMGLTPKAIKSLLWRARENLREVLEPYIVHGTRPARDT